MLSSVRRGARAGARMDEQQEGSPSAAPRRPLRPGDVVVVTMGAARGHPDAQRPGACR
eukprot:gene41241-61827_t